MNFLDPFRLLDSFGFADVVDILLVTAILFLAFRLVQGTRAIQLLRGLAVVITALLILSNSLELQGFNWLVQQTLPALLIAIPVIFQPEIRRAIDKIGNVGSLLRFFRPPDENDEVIAAVAETCRQLSSRRHGALIVIERETGLQEFIDTGVIMNAIPTRQLLLTIFQKDTELHDGAVIIKNNLIAAASCIMPLSSSLVGDRKMGLRHRAGLGISEVSDALAILVSEETGQISFAHNGKLLRRRNPANLEDELRLFWNDAGRSRGGN